MKYNFLFYTTILLFLAWCNLIAAEKFPVPITVHNITDATNSSFPVALGVPLPRGKYFDPNRFVVKTAEGKSVLTQVEVLNRNWATDNSLRHILVQFNADIAANQSSVYYLHDTGNNQTSGVLHVNESSDKIIINTGVLLTTINKKSFSLFDEVIYDANGNGVYEPQEKIIQLDTWNGGILVHWNGSIQKSSDAPFADRPFKVAIEENGPIRAVIRIETDTYSRSNEKQYHGYQVRFYFFNQSNMVRIRYTLKNSDYTIPERRLFYFDDFSLFSKLAFMPSTLKFGTDRGIFEVSPVGAYYLYQKRHDQFEIRNQNDQLIQTGEKGRGWMELADNSRGVLVVVRDFWQMWPNALEYTSNNQIRIGLWPRFGQDWWWGEWDDSKTISTSGLYWLDDMQEATKEVWYIFHKGDVDDKTLKDWVKLVQTPPVGSVPLKWYSATRSTLDLGGYIPIQEELQAEGDLLTLLKGEYGTERSEDWSSGVYMYGWFNYAGNLDRRGACGGGGWPYSGARFILTGYPLFYHLMRAKAMGELNGRPMWLSGYEYAKHQSQAQLFFGYCWNSWRRKPEDEPYLPGTSRHFWKPRDLAHLWIYDLEVYYYFSGDKRIKDWYEFMGEALAVPLIEHFAEGNLISPQTRSLGHSLAALIQAYKVTGKPSFLQTAKKAVKALRDRQVPYNGTFVVRRDNPDKDGEAPFQMGYVARALINFLEEIGETNPENAQAYLDAWGVLQGIMEWNLNLAKYTYYWKPGVPTEVSGTGVTLADPEAWFYLHTGQKQYLNQLIWYIDNGAYGDLRNWGWQGNSMKYPWELFVGRITHFLLKYGKSDTQKPDAVEDLSVSLMNQKLLLRWTAPAESTRFHIRWSTRPIASEFTTQIDSCNFWAARGIDIIPTAKPNQKMEVELQASTFPSGKTIYFALVAFDNNNNMSEVSNVVDVEVSVTGANNKKNIPREFRFLGSLPNPFTRGIQFRFINDTISDIRIAIYDIRGREIYSMTKANLSSGFHGIRWNGTALDGTPLTNGIYFFQIQRGRQILARGKILKIH